MSDGMILNVFKLILIFLCVVFCCNYVDGVYYKIKNIECMANQNHFRNISCVLKPVNWTRSVLNMDCNIIGSLNNGYLVVDTFYKDSTNHYKPFLFNFKFNICQLLEKAKPIQFFERYALHHLKVLTNVNHSCPYSGRLFARNFYLDEMSLPPLPLQEYKIMFNFTQIKPAIHLGLVLLYFEAREEYRKRPKAF